MASIATSNDTQRNGGNHIITVKTANFASSTLGSTGSDQASTITAAISEVKNSASYEVSVTAMNGGYVSEITITGPAST